MTEQDKKEPDAEEDKKNDSSEPLTIDKVKEIAKEVVDGALDAMRKLVDSNDDGEDGDKGDPDDPKGKKGEGRTKRTYRTIEEDAERLVREAWEKVAGEKEAEREEAKKKQEEEHKKKKEPDKAPIKVRKLTRIMLGKDYGQE